MIGWLPMTRRQWQEDRRLYEPILDRKPYLRDEGEIISRNANWLLGRLYEPDSKRGAVATPAARHRAEVEDEPINWGDLSASVERLGTGWVITLEEASPGACPTLCAYIQGWLEKWGWRDIMTQTEW